VFGEGRFFAKFARMIFLWWGKEKGPFFTPQKNQKIHRALPK
jgi:hypothetical protein